MTNELVPSLRGCLTVIGVGLLLLIATCACFDWYVTRGYDGPRMLTGSPIRLTAGEAMSIGTGLPLRGPGPINELCGVVAKPGKAFVATTPAGSEYVIHAPAQDTARLTAVVVGNDGRSHRLSPTAYIDHGDAYLCFRPSTDALPVNSVEITADRTLVLETLSWFSGDRYD